MVSYDRGEICHYVGLVFSEGRQSRGVVIGAATIS